MVNLEKYKKYSIASILILLLIFLLAVIFNFYRILTAKVIVITKPNKTLEVYDKVYVSDLILKLNGHLVKDKLIDTTKLGKRKVTFDFINNDNIRVSSSINVNIKDTIKPIIGVPSTFTVTKGYNEDLSKEFFCGDNYDNTPKCIVEGEYNFNTPGNYNVTFKAIDKSKNINSYQFLLNVVDPSVEDNEESIEPKTVNLQDVINTYKNKNTKIGVDISKWQGEVDYKKVKSSGVEFVMLRVGSEDKNGNYFVDPTFLKNIEGFNKIKMPVGIYYYSYANSKEKAKKEARWVIKQIKKYKIDLPIVFDWENWSNYQDYKLSFHSLSQISNTFLEEIEKAGYEGMLYSSKYYLENIWEKSNYKIWLAHYTQQTDYQGQYYLWQLCSNGKVAGIDNNLVDINVMYN